MDRFFIHNGRNTILREHIKGLMVLEDKFETIDDPFNYILYKKNLDPQKVRVIISGGGGVGALFSGFVGDGLADGMAHGDFFCAPTAYSLFELGKKINDQKGLLLLANNFSGDFLNNDMAVELLESEGILTKVIYCSDDIFSAIGESKENRGGLCGITFLIKIAAEAARQGYSLDEVYEITQQAEKNLRSVAVTISKDGKMMNFGEGFSGEKAPVSLSYSNLDNLVDNAFDFLFKDFSRETTTAHDRVCYVSINKFRSLSMIEAYAIAYSVHKKISKAGLLEGGITVGDYFDGYEPSGCIFSVLLANPDMVRFIKPVKGYSFTV